MPETVDTQLFGAFHEESFTSWRSCVAYIHGDFPGRDRWVSRGEKCATWIPAPSLERLLVGRFRSERESAPWWEEMLLREFKRHAHRHLKKVPRNKDIVEWWALLQHFGGPTRLLDWTYSIWVALFFALERATPRGFAESSPVSVWSIDADWLRNRFLSRLPSEQAERIPKDPKRPKVLRSVFVDDPPVAVKLANPAGRLSSSL